MHRIPIGPMGADRKIPIDTQPINIDIIVPTQEVNQLQNAKIVIFDDWLPMNRQEIFNYFIV